MYSSRHGQNVAACSRSGRAWLSAGKIVVAFLLLDGGVIADEVSDGADGGKSWTPWFDIVFKPHDGKSR